MPVSTASVLTGATITPSGGSALAFSSKGIVGNTNTIFVDADSSSLTRRSMVVTVKEAKISATAPNGMTQERALFVYKVPKTLANGLVTVNKVSIEFSTDVETTDAEKDELGVIGAQICTDADFANARKRLSLS